MGSDFWYYQRDSLTQSELQGVQLQFVVSRTSNSGVCFWSPAASLGRRGHSLLSKVLRGQCQRRTIA